LSLFELPQAVLVVFLQAFQFPCQVIVRLFQAFHLAVGALEIPLELETLLRLQGQGLGLRLHDVISECYHFETW